jgi:ribosome-binding protein aMBF1 (putative translation factor)
LLIEGPMHVGMPLIRPLGQKLYEIRARGRDGIARAIYSSASGKRLIVLRVFVKKTQATPASEIALAKKTHGGSRMSLIPWNKVRAESLADPAVKAEHDRLGPMFAVAEAVIRARKAARLTQAQLAARMGAKQPFVARIESGGTIPSTSTLVKIAEATGTVYTPTFVPMEAPTPKRRRKAPDAHVQG